MKRVRLAIISLVPILFLTAPGSASACNVCHSKDPKMKKMHQELGYRDCFTCHGKGLKKSPEERKVQQTTDSRCIRCHGK